MFPSHGFTWILKSPVVYTVYTRVHTHTDGTVCFSISVIFLFCWFIVSNCSTTDVIYFECVNYWLVFLGLFYLALILALTCFWFVTASHPLAVPDYPSGLGWALCEASFVLHSLVVLHSYKICFMHRFRDIHHQVWTVNHVCFAVTGLRDWEDFLNF